jgi:hypothetical protein
VDRTVLGGESFPNGEALAEKKTLVQTTITVTVVFIISSSTVNPYLYYFQSRKYRAEVRQLFASWKAGGSSDSDTEGTVNILTVV